MVVQRNESRLHRRGADRDLWRHERARAYPRSTPVSARATSVHCVDDRSGGAGRVDSASREAHQGGGSQGETPSTETTREGDRIWMYQVGHRVLLRSLKSIP